MGSRYAFSPASVILSYFLVAGGAAASLILFRIIEVDSEWLLYGILSGGGVVGGFVAARASRGSTVLEPAVGGVLVVATIVGVFVGTPLGDFLWHVGPDEIKRIVGMSGAAAAGGAVAGALVSEKVVGGHSRATLEWLLLVVVAVLGACLVATLVLMGFMLRGESDDDTQAGVLLGAMALGALLSGLSAGAMAPRRILLVAFAGSVAGVMAFYLLARALPNTKDDDGAAAAGFAIIGVGCGLVTLLGAAIGWAAVGRRASRA